MSDKIKRIINIGLPVNVCNFRCHYCYVGQTYGYSHDNPDLPCSVEKVAKALSYKRMGGPCLINLCGGGETMMGPYIVPLTRALLEQGHYVTLVTNGSMSKKYEELVAFPEALRAHLFMKFSFHYLELKRQNLFDVYFDNVRRMRDGGVSFSVELTANDESIPYIPEIKALCQKELGAWCHIIESRNDQTPELHRLTKLPAEQHLKAWESFHTPLISFQKTTWEKHRHEFCYAGDWLFNVNLWSGEIGICLKVGKSIGNIYENMDEPVHVAAIGQNCPWAHCFSSYFLMTNGVIPELNTPCYGTLRDRVCTDGSHWLQKDVAAFFQTKLVESNAEYDAQKKQFINALMAIVYENTDMPADYEALGKIVTEKCHARGIRSVCVWLGRQEHLPLEHFVREVLAHSGLKVCCFVLEAQETEKASVKTALRHRLKYPLKVLRGGDVLLNERDHVPVADAVVAVDYTTFEQDRARMQAFSAQAAKLLPITELAD